MSDPEADDQFDLLEDVEDWDAELGITADAEDSISAEVLPSENDGRSLRDEILQAFPQAPVYSALNLSSSHADDPKEENEETKPEDYADIGGWDADFDDDETETNEEILKIKTFDEMQPSEEEEEDPFDAFDADSDVEEEIDRRKEELNLPSAPDFDVSLSDDELWNFEDFSDEEEEEEDEGPIPFPSEDDRNGAPTTSADECWDDDEEEEEGDDELLKASPPAATAAGRIDSQSSLLKEKPSKTTTTTTTTTKPSSPSHSDDEEESENVNPMLKSLRAVLESPRTKVTKSRHNMKLITSFDSSYVPSVAAAASSNIMRFNAKLLRWEGNEEALDVFAAPKRPALISQMRKPAQRITVGQMVYNPEKMCWEGNEELPELTDFRNSGPDLIENNMNEENRSSFTMGEMVFNAERLMWEGGDDTLDEFDRVGLGAQPGNESESEEENWGDDDSMSNVDLRVA